jgi:hypothetical protein
MTTYLKHFYVDPITGEAFTDNRQTPNGKSHPAIPNLDVKYWLKTNDGVDFCLSVTNASFDSSAIKGVTVLTEAQWFDIVKGLFDKVKADKIKEVFDYVKQVKHMIIDDWWHSSEVTAAVGVKVVEAKFVLEQSDEATAMAGAPILAAEASTRKISIFDLAQRISFHNNNLMIAEAVVTGHRGFITDRIDAITFTPTIEGAQASFAEIAKHTASSDDSENSYNYVNSFNKILAQLGIG